MRATIFAILLLVACGGSDSAPAGDGGPGGADAGAPDAALQPGSEYVFDQDALRTYELVVDDADWQWLNDNARLEEYVPAMLRFEGQEYGPIGVRYKGGYGTLTTCFDGAGNRICPKISMKLKFNEYDPEMRFYGLKRLNFHSMTADPSMMRDRLAYALFNDVGVYAPRAVHARLIVNGELLGVFALVEQIDGRFTRERFPDGGEGNLYKEIWPLYQQEQPYLNALKTNEDQMPDVSKMVRFAADVAGAGTDDEMAAVLDTWTDVDMLMRYMAVDRAIENWDGIVAWYCVGGPCFNHNYYWYEDVGADRVWLIPWDMDHTFTVPSPIVQAFGMPTWDEWPVSCDPILLFNGIRGRAPACDPTVRSLSTALWNRYAAATASLLDGPFQTDPMFERLDRWSAQIADAVAEDPNIDGYTQWEFAVGDMKAALITARQGLVDKLGL